MPVSAFRLRAACARTLAFARLATTALRCSRVLSIAFLVCLVTQPPAIAATQAQVDASRFLAQGTFGADQSSIDTVASIGFENWLTDQFNTPPSLHLPAVLGQSAGGADIQRSRYRVFWNTAINAPDQLRQRVALALSEIMVVSDMPDALLNHSNLLAAYYDVLVNNAFGNYRDLLEAVTLSPAMGVYLSMLGNEKPEPSIGRRADENYAREVMQLFSIGLVRLNQDGSVVTSGGVGVPAFEQPDVAALARALTGWSWDRPDWSVDAISGWFPDRTRMNRSMVPFDDHHDLAGKTFLGATLPAGQNARQDLTAALDTIANHPNVGPFLSRQLIQRLVTSNPSPAYINRVAAVFNNNGAGQRGDLKAVVRAILLDAEARSADVAFNDPSFGKLREPLLRFSHLWRAFRVKEAPQVSYYASLMSQHAPLTARSVFNFFKPDFSPPGDLRNAGLVAPEFQINSETWVNTVNSALQSIILSDSFLGLFSSRLSLEPEFSLASLPDQLVDRLDLVLMAGSMSPGLRAVLLRYADANRGRLDNITLVRQMVALTITSADYAIQR